MSFQQLLALESANILVTAPPAWGKTRLLLQIFPFCRRWIFLSPLRALAEEFSLAIKTHGFPIWNLQREEDWTNFTKSASGVLVATPEKLFQLKGLDTKIEGLESTWVVFDEFHLFYSWGGDFRPILYDCVESIFGNQINSLCLSATMSVSWLELWKTHTQLNYDHVVHLDFGNCQLKNLPQKCEVFSPRFSALYQGRIERYFIEKLAKGKTDLLFCRYRQEVESWSCWLKSLGFEVLSCVGGEAPEFSQEMGGILKTKSYPDVIVATSVLGHGVNLPQIGTILFTGEVGEFDMWLQMVGRGGRKGEKFDVITCDSYLGACRWQTLTMEFLLQFLQRLTPFFF